MNRPLPKGWFSLPVISTYSPRLRGGFFIMSASHASESCQPK
jgi:hypothetical protein